MESKPRKLEIALAISLALNLFFVGFAVGRRSGLFHGHHGPRHAHGRALVQHGERPPGPGMDLGPSGFLRRVGIGDAGPEVARVLEARRDELRAQRGAVRRARAAVAGPLNAEPFDAEKLAAALEALRTESADAQARMHATLVEVARTLSPEQRRRMAQAPWFMAEPKKQF
jgi:uncharacterized membrane protein